MQPNAHGKACATSNECCDAGGWKCRLGRCERVWLFKLKRPSTVHVNLTQNAMAIFVVSQEIVNYKPVKNDQN